MSIRNVEVFGSTTQLEGSPSAAGVGYVGSALYTRKFGSASVRQIDDSSIAAPGIDGAINYAEIALTNAEIKALRAAAKLLVAAPGAGKMINLLRALIILDAGANALTEAAANLDLRYVGKAAGVLSTTEATGFIDQITDQAIHAIVAQDKLITKANSENLGLELFNNGAGEYGGNAAADALLRVKVWYTVVPTGW